MKTLDDVKEIDTSSYDTSGMPKPGDVVDVGGVKCEIKRVKIGGASQLSKWAMDDEDVDPHLVFTPSDRFYETDTREGMVIVVETDHVFPDPRKHQDQSSFSD